MATGYMPDISQMRQQYTNVLADQQKKALQGVQGMYAQRGITGGGEEAQAFGNLGQQFGLGAGQAESQLQQYFGNLGQQQAQFGEQQRQFDVGQGNWGQQFGENQRQFNTGQGNWQQQFGLNQNQQQFGQNMSLAGLYSQGLLGKNPFGEGSQFGSMRTQQEIDPLTGLAGQLGLGNASNLQLYQSTNPEAFKDLFNRYAGGLPAGQTGQMTPSGAVQKQDILDRIRSIGFRV